MEDFINFSNAIDEYMEKNGVSEDEAIEFVINHWKVGEGLVNVD